MMGPDPAAGVVELVIRHGLRDGRDSDGRSTSKTREPAGDLDYVPKKRPREGPVPTLRVQPSFVRGQTLRCR